MQNEPRYAQSEKSKIKILVSETKCSEIILHSANNSQLLQFVTSRLPITKYCNNYECSVYSSGLLRKLVHSAFA